MNSSVKKKTYNPDSELIEKVRRVFHAKTDAEAIQRALQKAVDDAEIQNQNPRALPCGGLRFRETKRADLTHADSERQPLTASE